MEEVMAESTRSRWQRGVEACPGAHGRFSASYEQLWVSPGHGQLASLWSDDCTSTAPTRSTLLLSCLLLQFSCLPLYPTPAPWIPMRPWPMSRSQESSVGSWASFWSAHAGGLQHRSCAKLPCESQAPSYTIFCLSWSIPERVQS